MAAPKKEKLTLGIDGYPSLEPGFLLAIVSRSVVSLPIVVQGRQYRRDVFVDSLRVHPRKPDTLIIDGHFRGDGKKSWVNVGGQKENSQPEKEYYLWGRFRIIYDIALRMGILETNNYAFSEEIFAGLRAKEAKAS